MSNRADESYELFYNATEGIVGNAILLEEDASVLDELHYLLASFEFFYTCSILIFVNYTECGWCQRNSV